MIEPSGLRTRLASTDPAVLLRGGIVALAALGVVGLLVELAFLRHWSTVGALVVWPALAAAAAAVVALVRRPTAGRVRLVRWLALAVVVVGIAGIVLHVNENLIAGPLDRSYAATWDSLSAVEQLFLAVTGGVGPAPALAPGSMSELGLAIALATFRHPALEARASIGLRSA
ncbi:MAG TPA: hypothetical protein VFI15_10735 [Candidatus Limnocylindrales bacterium]|nr:hypothetical protein [Candidatus Limnocylindrales bacterium]